MMKTLVTGARGQLGQDLCQELTQRGIAVTGIDVKDCDITDRQAVERVFDAVCPDVVIHCAGYTQVDQAERDTELCRRVNVEGSGNIAECCRKHGAYMVLISTDYVFDGNSQVPYLPEDPTCPISVYGASKAEAEQVVLTADEGNCVVRTSWLFGIHGRNFVSAILNKARQAKEIQVVADEVGSPTYSGDLVKLLAEIAVRKPSGILHATNENICSRSEFAWAAIQMAGADCRVEEISSESYPSLARRPHYSVLSKDCLDKWGLPRLPDWKDALNRYIRALEGEK